MTRGGAMTGREVSAAELSLLNHLVTTGHEGCKTLANLYSVVDVVVDFMVAVVK